MKAIILTFFCLWLGAFSVGQAQPGYISTVAGAGGTSPPNDGGDALLAHFNGINRVVFDAQGNMFISEYYGDRIRRVDATTNIITTITSGGLNEPFGMEFDAAGHMYFAEFGNSRIYKVQATTGVITQLSGSEGFADSVLLKDARFKTIADITFGPDGNLYIADMWNDRIRMIKLVGDTINPLTDSVVTVVGNGLSGYAGDGLSALDPAVRVRGVIGLAFDSQGHLFFCSENNVVRRVDKNTGILTTFAGTGVAGFKNGQKDTAQFHYPHDLQFDKNENLYLTDCYNHRIRKISPTGMVSTIGGTGTAGSTGDGGSALLADITLPGGIMLSNNGDLFFGEGGSSQRVRKIETVGFPLPVEILNFQAISEKQGIKLEWTTASESNNDYFSLERSLDGTHFFEIGTLPGSGNSKQLQTYSFMDRQPVPGVNYYRLKQTDFEGLRSYSSLIKAYWGGTYQSVKVYPIPVQDVLTIELPAEGANGEVWIKVYDLKGQILMVQKTVPQKGLIAIRMDDWAKGIYILKIHSLASGLRSTHRIVR